MSNNRLEIIFDTTYKLVIKKIKKLTLNDGVIRW